MGVLDSPVSSTVGVVYVLPAVWVLVGIVITCIFESLMWRPHVQRIGTARLEIPKGITARGLKVWNSPYRFPELHARSIGRWTWFRGFRPRWRARARSEAVDCRASLRLADGKGALPLQWHREGKLEHTITLKPGEQYDLPLFITDPADPDRFHIYRVNPKTLLEDRDPQYTFKGDQAFQLEVRYNDRKKPEKWPICVKRGNDGAWQIDTSRS